MTSASRTADARAARVVEFFEQLSPADLARVGEFYTAGARFKDPFNDVQGTPAIRAVFDHMFIALEAPRFVIHDVVADGDQCFLTWDFRFRFRRFAPGAEQLIRGSTQLHFAPDGRIAHHRDYWDAAAELYEKLPVIGTLMRWLRRRAST